MNSVAIQRARTKPTKAQIKAHVKRSSLLRLAGLYGLSIVGSFYARALAPFFILMFTGVAAAAYAALRGGAADMLSRRVEVGPKHVRIETYEGSMSFPRSAVKSHRIEGQVLHLDFDDQPSIAVPLHRDDRCSTLLREAFPNAPKVRVAGEVAEAADFAEEVEGAAADQRQMEAER